MCVRIKIRTRGGLLLKSFYTLQRNVLKAAAALNLFVENFSSYLSCPTMTTSNDCAWGQTPIS